MKRRIYFSPIIIIIVLFIVLSLATSFLTSFNDHEYIATVTDKERIVETKNNDVKSYYLIFCKDAEGNYYEFKNEDLWLRGKFNSSNIYNKIDINKSYKFTVVGYRIGLFSWYENIIKFEEIK